MQLSSDALLKKIISLRSALTAKQAALDAADATIKELQAIVRGEHNRPEIKRFEVKNL